MESDFPFTKFCLVPRGTTIWEKQNLLQGKTSVLLDPQGIEEANILKEKLENIPFDMALTAEQESSRQTAEIILSGKDVDYIIEPLFRERDWGEWEEQPTEALRQQHPLYFDKMFQPPLERRVKEKSTNPFREAEDFVVFGERLHRGFVLASENFPEKNVLVVLGKQPIVALFSMIGMTVSELTADSVFLFYVEKGRCRFVRAWKAKAS